MIQGSYQMAGRISGDKRMAAIVAIVVCWSSLPASGQPLEDPALVNRRSTETLEASTTETLGLAQRRRRGLSTQAAQRRHWMG